MYILKDGTYLSKQDIDLIISNFIIKTINNNEPYVCFMIEEPFANSYNGKITYDYSGDIRKMTYEDIVYLKKLLLNSTNNYSSRLEKFLEQVYVKEWKPTEESPLNRAWLTYRNLSEDLYNDWKFNNFDFFDKNDLENEDLDIELDTIFYEFVEKTSYELYYARLLSTFNSNYKLEKII
ncbi:MAG: hypothetical protein N4A54_12350 [Peptostreptococcaceae bacterium]|nr:hypothetical protein [Peptostreptococcaceae bacterium]